MSAAQPGETLLAFELGDDRFVCELRDDTPFSVEARLFRNGELLDTRRFEETCSLTARDQAMVWAKNTRNAMAAVSSGS